MSVSETPTSQRKEKEKKKKEEKIIPVSLKKDHERKRFYTIE
jgi:hypothetical protein